MVAHQTLAVVDFPYELEPSHVSRIAKVSSYAKEAEDAFMAPHCKDP